jgi:hypothetical protein
MVCPRSPADERGMTTAQYVAGTAFSLLAFVLMANFIAFLYARGVVRAAVDEGARAGGRLAATEAECQARASDVLDDLLGGALGEEVRVTCREDRDRDVMSARADVVLRGWLPGVMPDWYFTLEAQSVKEGAP